MRTSSGERSSIAQTISDATRSGVDAARNQDVAELNLAVDILANHADAARELHALAVRELLEMSYQDGIDGDDISDVLTRMLNAAHLWGAPLDPQAAVTVLTGALGITGTPDENMAAIPADEIVRAAILVIHDLVTDTKADLKPCLDRAIDEVRRAQTVESP